MALTSGQTQGLGALVLRKAAPGPHDPAVVETSVTTVCGEGRTQTCVGKHKAHVALFCLTCTVLASLPPAGPGSLLGAAVFWHEMRHQALTMPQRRILLLFTLKSLGCGMSRQVVS